MIQCKTILLLYLLFFISVFAQSKDENMDAILMPVPAKLHMTGSKYILKDSFQIVIKGEAEHRLYRYTTRFLRRLAGRTGLFFTQDYLSAQTAPEFPDFIIFSRDKGKVQLNVNESYQLIVTKTGISLNSETDIGAIRGLETLLQLLKSDTSGYYFPTVEIEDAPRFP